MVMGSVTMKSAGDFKTHCLALMDDVHASGGEIVITKRGRPVARLVPVVPDARGGLFGRLSGSMRIQGDLVSSLDEKWDAEEA